MLPQLTPTIRLRWLVPARQPTNAFYFVHIANFHSGKAWLVQNGFSLNDAEVSRAEMLAEQIHILATIATRKFVLLRLAIAILFIGWTVSLVASSW